jgi:hypothetical protein
MSTGSCLCGAVRYELRGDPALMYYCHCGTCRKANGSSFATNLIVPADDFTITAGRERLTAFESSPAKHRYFCSACGSPIYSHAEATKHIVSVRCGTLDGDPGVRPAVHTYVATRAPWFEITDAIPQKPASFV